jgi:CubicO group peptidase (beta-lactamase class C family)
MGVKHSLLAGIGAAALSACISVSEVRTPAPSTLTNYPQTSELAGAPRGISQDRLRRLDEAMKAYVDAGRLAGAVVMVQQDGRDVFSEAYGWRDKEANDPMREDTIFRIASQTKALTSVAIMMLMEEGKLVMDDPLGKL